MGQAQVKAQMREGLVESYRPRRSEGTRCALLEWVLVAEPKLLEQARRRLGGQTVGEGPGEEQAGKREIDGISATFTRTLWSCRAAAR